MRLTEDERRALTFVALLIALSAAARVGGRAGEVMPEAPEVDLAALEGETAEAVAAAERRRRPLAPGERLDPNRAPAAALDRLPRVGRSLADRIVRERERGGPYRRPEDLTRVSGIGEKTAERLAPYLDFSAAPPPRLRVAPPGRGDGAVEGRVELNRATAEQLERLPGIGPVLARRIVAHRDSVGGFRTLDDLDDVPGIGPKTLERLRPMLRLAP